MSLIGLNNVTFCYEGALQPVFENLTLQLDTDWKLGFVGRNGRGKTTLLRLLQGELSCTGEITGRMETAFFPQRIHDDSAATLEVALQLCPNGERWQLERELSLLEVPSHALERPFRSLSGGERTKVQLAALFLRRGCYQLIDEPTNHLDAAGRALVSRYLSAQRGFALVSHDRDFLDGCIDHVLAFQRTGPVVLRGDCSTYLENRARQDAFEQQQNERLRRDIRQLEEASRRTEGWADKVERSKSKKSAGLEPGSKVDRGYIGHKAAKMMKRAKSLEQRRDRAVQEKQELLTDSETAEPLRMHPLEHHARSLVSLREVQVLRGGWPVCAPVTLQVEQGQRVALLGGNGSGKTSLLQLIAEQRLQYTGTLRMAANLQISVVQQDTSRLSGSITAFAAEQGVEETLLLATLRKLDFSRLQFAVDLGDMSEGQKKKALLAASLCKQAHLYLWDEPLNYVDLLSRAQLEQLLTAFCPTMLFVEHDAAFCRAVATHTVQLERL